MKKTLMIMSLFLLPGVALAGDYSSILPGSGINGTAHDLRDTQTAGQIYQADDGDLNRICIWCHAPHHTLKPAQMVGDIDYLPLWNHAVSTTVSFQAYNNGADEPWDIMGGHASQAEEMAGQPGGVSKLCLSCHDGSVAVNEYGFDPSPAGSRDSGGIAILSEFRIGEGGDLSNHHPIGFSYDNVQVMDDEIADSAATPIGANGYYIADLLWEGKMECTTCHDVHNTKNTGEKFLWVSDANSNLCLTCHLKGSPTSPAL